MKIRAMDRAVSIDVDALQLKSSGSANENNDGTLNENADTFCLQVVGKLNIITTMLKIFVHPKIIKAQK